MSTLISLLRSPGECVPLPDGFEGCVCVCVFVRETDRDTEGRAEGKRERKRENQKMYREGQNKDLLEKFVLLT